MPNTTINFDLPYPSGVDRPCDFAEQWCEFTAAIDGVFDTFQAGIDRTIPVIPMALVQLTAPASVFNFNPIPFDTVLVDTAAMVDMDVDPFTITIKRPGRYTVAGGIQKPSISSGTAQTSIFIQPENDAQAIVNDIGTDGVIVYCLDAYKSVETHAVGDQIRLAYSVGTSNFFTISSAWLSAVWHSDTEVP